MKQLLSNSNAVKININFTENSIKKINETLKNGLNYFVINITGDSMTCEDKTLSIPDKSKVLICESGINTRMGLYNIWHDIPTGKALVLSGITSKGKEFRVCKIIQSIDVVHEMVLLESLNVKHVPQWIPFAWINDIYEVLQIVE
ncbi:MAG: hypothetical protein ACOVMH_01815 [Flavobacterium sp.]